jgi:hypothetical protein
MKRIIIASLLVITILLSASLPVMAFLTNPTDISLGDYESNRVAVLRNLAEPGDSAFLFHIKIPFESINGTVTYPTETAADTMVLRLYDTAGNLTASKTPYVFSLFNTNGYDNNIVCFYFGPDDGAPAWGSAARFNIMGWPAYFAGLDQFNYNLAANDYTSATSQADNQEEMKELILLWCDRFDSIYDITLKSSSDSEPVLSPYGESYFAGVIPGLQNMCPDLFYIQVYVPVASDYTYNMTMADTYAGRIAGTDLEDGFNNLGAGIGVSGTFFAILLFIGVSVALCVVFVRKGWGLEIGGVISGIIGIAGALILGNIIFALLMIASLAAVMVIVWLLLLRRSP